MPDEYLPAATPGEIAEIRAILRQPRDLDALVDSDYSAFADEVDELYGALTDARQKSAAELFDDIVPFLDHTEASLRKASIWALSWFTHGDAARAAWVHDHAAALWTADPDVLVRSVALMVWAEPYANTVDTEALRRLAAVLYDEDEDEFVRQEAYIGILSVTGYLDEVRARDPSAVSRLTMGSGLTVLHVDWTLTGRLLTEAGL